MLIKGLGRIEGTVEDLQPVTLKQLIPNFVYRDLLARRQG